MRASLLLIVVGAVLIAALGFGSQRSSRAANDARASEAAELRALRSETDRLRAAVAALEHAHRDPRAATPTASALPPEILARLNAASAQQPVREAEPGTKLTPAQERASMLQYGKYLDDQLARSQTDGAAAASLKAKASDFFDKSSALLDLQCGQELCRMKTRHEDIEAYRAFQNDAFQQDGRIWNGPVTFIVQQEPDDTGQPLVAAIYLGRGQALPSPEPAR